MTEISPFTPERKSRREALSLLLGTALLGSAACSQPDKPPTDGKQTDVARPNTAVIVLEDNGSFDPIFDRQHLRKQDTLVVVNIGSLPVSFQISNCPFTEEGSTNEKTCVSIQINKKKKLKIKGNPGQYKFGTMLDDKCAEFAPESALAAGEIIIDP